jgi:hypothetical protein
LREIAIWPFPTRNHTSESWGKLSYGGKRGNLGVEQIVVTVRNVESPQTGVRAGPIGGVGRRDHPGPGYTTSVGRWVERMTPESPCLRADHGDPPGTEREYECVRTPVGCLVQDRCCESRSRSIDDDPAGESARPPHVRERGRGLQAGLEVEPPACSRHAVPDALVHRAHLRVGPAGESDGQNERVASPLERVHRNQDAPDTQS